MGAAANMAHCLLSQRLSQGSPVCRKHPILQFPPATHISPREARPGACLAVKYTATARSNVDTTSATAIPTIVLMSSWIQFWHTVVREIVDYASCTQQTITFQIGPV